MYDEKLGMQSFVVLKKGIRGIYSPLGIIQNTKTKWFNRERLKALNGESNSLGNFRYVGVGIGDSTPTIYTMENLNDEYSDSDIDESYWPAYSRQEVSSYYDEDDFRFILNTTFINNTGSQKTISEIGLFNAEIGGLLGARIDLLEALGERVLLADEEILGIKWEFRLT